MAFWKKIFFGVVWVITTNLLSAQTASILNYQGHMTVAGKPFSGQGFFSFVILDDRGMILWASGEFPFEGSAKMPVGALKLPVNHGAYSVRLGDTTAGMPVLDGALLKNAALPRLRVWFNDGTRGWQKAGDDISLAAALGLPGDSGNTALNTVQADSILRELRDLRAKLDRPSATPPAHEHPEAAEPKFVTVSLGSSPSLGRADAPLVLVEFTDYQCGFCKRFHEGVMPELIKNYVETGKLRIVSRNLALSFHENAEPAAQAALCAHQQQKFWPMREKLFANIAMLTSTNLMKAAEELKLDMTAFRLCIGGKTYASQIAKDGQEAGAAGINGTPTFVLGKPTGEKVTGLLIVGARPYAAFDAEIQKMLPPVK